MDKNSVMHSEIDHDKELRRIIEELDVVFLASYPKSGNTWLRFLLGTLCQKTEVDWHNVNSLMPIMDRRSYEQVASLKSPRIIPTHYGFDEKYKKAIFITRDGRDVAISYYKWCLRSLNNFNEDFNIFLKRFVEGKIGYGSWKDNVEGWLQNWYKLKKGFIWIKYENMKKDIYTELKRILDFLNINPKEKEIQNAVEWASFNNMKKLEKEQKGAEGLLNECRNIPFVREGKCRGWKDVFSKCQKDLVKHSFGQTLIDLGYESSFDW